MGIITLLSDFGLQDASVASAKAAFMQQVPGAEIVDISHLVEPYHLLQAAYLLTSAYRNFPENTIHVLLFDVFSEKTPRLVLAQKAGQYFLAPDNGVLSLAFDNTIDHVWKCFELSQPLGFKDWLIKTATIVQKLQSGIPTDLQPFELKNAPHYCRPKVQPNSAECQVIHIDRFENVVINLTKEQFDTIGKGRPFRIEFMRDEAITQLSTHYQNVRSGDVLCRFNAAGYLEIAINHGKAASLLGLRLHREQDSIYNTIKIHFE
jgi:S-adenosylmethionine hydrolase